MSKLRGATHPLQTSQAIFASQFEGKPLVLELDPTQVAMKVTFQKRELPVLLTHDRSESRLEVRVLALQDESEGPAEFGSEEGDFLEHCLRLSISVPSLTSHIDELNSTQNCNQPQPGGGKFLLALADEIHKSHFVKEAGLEDAAKVSCDAFPEIEAELSLLQIFKKGKTWYGQHGFTVDPLKIQPRVFKKAEKSLRDWKMKEISSQLSKLRQGKGPKQLVEHYQHCGLEAKSLESAIQKAGSSATLGPLMTHLWQTDCRAYSDAIHFLFPKTPKNQQFIRWGAPACGEVVGLDPKENFPWNQQWKTVQSGLAGMIKTY